MTAHARGGEGRPRPAAAPEPALNPLQRLIQQRLRERGWSYGQVARRGGLPRSTVHTLAATRNLTRPPRPATIDALAKGLEVPVAAVRAAAAESIARHYYDRAPAEPGHPADREKELLIASIDELMPDDRRHVAALVDSLRNKTSPEPGGPLAPAPAGTSTSAADQCSPRGRRIGDRNAGITGCRAWPAPARSPRTAALKFPVPKPCEPPPLAG
jgi:transcriptional regulator with XRE-family HTH domain